MSLSKLSRFVVMMALVAGVVLVSRERADARPRTPADDRQDKKRLALIHNELDAVQKEPSLFDGAHIPATADFGKVGPYLDVAEHALRTFDSYWTLITDVGKAWPDGVALKTKYDRLKPYIAAARAEHTRVLPIVAAQRDKQAADNKAQIQATAEAGRKANQDRVATQEAARKHMQDVCNGFWRKVGWGDERKAAVFAGTSLQNHLPITADTFAKLVREGLPKVEAVCNDPAFAEAPTLCKSVEFEVDGASIADACTGARKRDEVLQAGVLTALENNLKSRGAAPTAAELKARDGWIQTTDKFVYAEYMFFTDAARRAAIKEWQALFDAAGVKIPEQHPMWDRMKAYSDDLRAAVEELAPTWPVPGKACHGYWCPLVTKAVKEWHPSAKILRVQMDDTVRLQRDDHDRATSAYLNGWVLFQVPGETWCQLRAWSVSEDGTGRADGVPLQYVRVQKCK